MHIEQLKSREEKIENPDVKKAEQILEDMKRIDEHADKAEERLRVIQEEHNKNENKS